MKKTMLSKVFTSMLSLAVVIGVFSFMPLQVNANELECGGNHYNSQGGYCVCGEYVGFGEGELECGGNHYNNQGGYCVCGEYIGFGEGKWDCEGVHFNYQDGYCICGEYVGFGEDKWDCEGVHFNYQDGYCICGEYVGFSSSRGTQTQVDKVENEAENSSDSLKEQIKEEEAIPVTDFVSEKAVSALPAEVKDISNTETVYNLSKIITPQGFIAAVEKMVEANENTNAETEAITFYTSSPIAFNASSLTALANANTEFVYMFNHEGHLYKVTIPAGVNVDLDGQGFAGPLYIGAKLGTSVLVE